MGCLYLRQRFNLYNMAPAPMVILKILQAGAKVSESLPDRVDLPASRLSTWVGQLSLGRDVTLHECCIIRFLEGLSHIWLSAAGVCGLPAQGSLCPVALSDKRRAFCSLSSLTHAHLL